MGNKAKKYEKALKEIADIYWETTTQCRIEHEVMEQIAQVIDRTDRTLWDKP